MFYQIYHQASQNRSILAILLLILQVIITSEKAVCQTPCPNAPSGATTFVNPSWSGTLPTTPIIIDGTLTITSTAILNANPNVYFTPGSSIQISSGATLTISSSTLDGCGQYWDGIYATSSSTGIIVTQSSTLSHMENGINATNDGLIQVDNSRFIDNGNQSIYLNNDDFGSTGSFIHNNTFETIISPLGQSPFASQLQSTHGIVIEDCWQVDIGDAATVSSGNIFRQLYNGILITWGSNNPFSTVGLHNNTFENIQDIGTTEFNKVGQTFTTFNGAGVYSDYYDLPNLWDLFLTVDNTSIGSGNVFDHCDKGIATLYTHLTAENLDIQDNLMGIMNASDMNNYDIHDINIIDNDGIDDNHFGIFVNDAYSSLNINHNKILVDHPVLNIVNAPPFGIRITGVVQSTSPTSNIDYNNISILTPAGYGIENTNGNTGQNITNNYIAFNSTDQSGPTNYFPKEIHGINNINSVGTAIMHNRVDGVNPFLFQTAFEHITNSTGIFMFNTEANVLRCNRVKFTAFGIYADDYNQANLVNANNMWNCVYPWYFDGGVGAGDATFGTIGTGIDDLENQWLCLENSISGICCQGVCNPNAYKIYRNNPSSIGDIIFTNPSLIVQAESESNAGSGFQYQILNFNSTLIDQCEEDDDFESQALINGITSSENLFYKNTAEQSLTNGNTPNFGEWYSRMKLMINLDTNLSLRNSDSTYISYYNQNLYSSIGQILFAEKAILQFKNTTPDMVTFEQRYAEAILANNLINSSLGFEQHEKEINSLIIKAHHIGKNNLNQQEKNTISYYAHGCPFSEGTSVFKARSLWSFFSPNEQYVNDSLCQVANKNSTYQFQVTSMQSENRFCIYPNPTKSKLTIKYSSPTDGIFKLFNSIGIEVFRVQLLKGSADKEIELPSNLLSGIYFYKGDFMGVNNAFGNLTIIKQ